MYNKVLIKFLLVAIFVVLCFEGEGIASFFEPIFGFISCVLFVIIAKIYGMLITKADDYYHKKFNEEEI